MKTIYKILTLLILFLISTTCGEEKKEEVKVIRPVNYIEVGALGIGHARTFSGTSKADEVINLSFRSGGIISLFELKLGQNVNKGQLLAKLDNVQSRLNYENAVSSLNSAASQMNTAKLSLDRIRLLYAKGSSSLSDFESAKNSYRTAKASYESAQRTVAIQQDQIGYGYLYAPAEGTIASISTEVNENVSAGQLVAVLNVSGDMEISLGLPESVINSVHKDMDVAISFSSINDEVFKGKVSEVSPSVDSNSSTYPVRIIVLNPTSNIKSGMAANVTFDFTDGTINKNTLIVPAKSVGEDDKGNYVFLLVENNDLITVKKQHVKIGNFTSEGVEIIEGLVAGQKIATAGLQTLLDGQEVNIY